jgi:hypothetical protein
MKTWRLSMLIVPKVSARIVAQTKPPIQTSSSAPISDYPADITQFGLQSYSFGSAADIQRIYARIWDRNIDLETELRKSSKGFTQVGNALADMIDKNKKPEDHFRVFKSEMVILMDKLGLVTAMPSSPL